MANPNSTNVSVAKPKVTGGALRAPLGTTLPTDATAAPDAKYVAVGYVGEGGVKLKMDRKSEKHRAWGGATVHVSQTEYGETYTLTLIESSNADVLKAVFGEANVVVTPASAGPPAVPAKITIKHNDAPLPTEVWVFDMKAGKDRRLVLPNAQITDVGDVTYADKDLIAYQISIDALPDASGNTAYEFLS